MLRIKTYVESQKGLGKLKRLNTFLTSTRAEGSLYALMNKAGNRLWHNVLARYEAGIWSSGEGGVMDTLERHAKAFQVRTPDVGLFEIGIGHTEALQAQTKIHAVGTGAEYSLWHIIEFGWGRYGGKRTDDYTLWYLEFPGVPPAFVEAESGHYYDTDVDSLTPVTHPGFSGIFGFLTRSGLMHEADAQVIPWIEKRVSAAIKSIEKS